MKKALIVLISSLVLVSHVGFCGKRELQEAGKKKRRVFLNRFRDGKAAVNLKPGFRFEVPLEGIKLLLVEGARCPQLENDLDVEILSADLTSDLTISDREKTPEQEDVYLGDSFSTPPSSRQVVSVTVKSDYLAKKLEITKNYEKEVKKRSQRERQRQRQEQRFSQEELEEMRADLDEACAGGPVNTASYYRIIGSDSQGNPIQVFMSPRRQQQ